MGLHLHIFTCFQNQRGHSCTVLYLFAIRKKAVSSSDDLYEFAHVEIRAQGTWFIQDRKLLLALMWFCYHWDCARMLHGMGARAEGQG